MIDIMRDCEIDAMGFARKSIDDTKLIGLLTDLLGRLEALEGKKEIIDNTEIDQLDHAKLAKLLLEYKSVWYGATLSERSEAFERVMALHARSGEPSRPIEDFIEELEEAEEPLDVAAEVIQGLITERDRALEDRDNAWNVCAEKNAALIPLTNEKRDLEQELTKFREDFDRAVMGEAPLEVDLTKASEEVARRVGKMEFDYAQCQDDEGHYRHHYNLVRAQRDDAIQLLNEQDGLQEQLDSLKAEFETYKIAHPPQKLPLRK